MNPPTPAAPLLASVRELILAARSQVARTVNSSLTLLYWQVGQRVRVDVLKEERAGYGLEILPTLSAKLVPEFGPGFSTRNLARMISFAERFSEPNVAARLA
ncbi:MAG: DUF1016 domain-containing protein, partial [Opitutaceae bacterium]|nr:DUF1016 domain-containing protein [Opitutaceae bacterium]